MVKLLIGKKHGQDFITLVILITLVLAISGILILLALYSLNLKMNAKIILIITCVLLFLPIQRLKKE